MPTIFSFRFSHLSSPRLKSGFSDDSMRRSKAGLYRLGTLARTSERESAAKAAKDARASADSSRSSLPLDW